MASPLNSCLILFFYWQDLSIHALQVKEHWPDEILSRALEDICLEKSYQEKCVFVLVHALQSYEDRMSKRKLKAVDCSSSLMPRYQLMVSSVLLTTLPLSFPGQCHFLLCIMGSEDLYLMLYWLLITIVDHVVHCFFESCSANMKKKSIPVKQYHISSLFPGTSYSLSCSCDLAPGLALSCWRGLVRFTNMCAKLGLSLSRALKSHRVSSLIPWGLIAFVTSHYCWYTRYHYCTGVI